MLGPKPAFFVAADVTLVRLANHIFAVKMRYRSFRSEGREL
ncbi:hypothetical protein BRAS3843_1670007 [Bradyrhizobium sp. STM 3843]|nr:hypothetical protein BRAS3843_1670007 [Bradyrhizobium sp. STM 3843]